MNIEEILNKIYTSDLLSSEELHELTEWVCNKDNEIERLNNIINKAIDYINDEGKSNNSNWLCQGREDLLDILKGVDKMTNDDVLDYLRKHLLILGEYIIKYNGIEEDSANGKTESWTIIRKIPLFEEKENQGGKAED